MLNRLSQIPHYLQSLMPWNSVSFEEFFEATKKDNRENMAIIERFIQYHPHELNRVGFTHSTALGRACQFGNKTAVRLLLAAPGININPSNSIHPLILAISSNIPLIVTALVTNPDLSDFTQWPDNQGNPLFLAAHMGNPIIVRVLLTKVRDFFYLDRRNTEGFNAAEIANNHGHTEVAEIIENKLEQVLNIYPHWRQYREWLRAGAPRPQSLSAPQPVVIAAPTFADRISSLEAKLAKEIVIPDRLKCIILHRIISDPITVSSGITYDRSALSEYFRAKGQATIACPETRILISKEELKVKTNILIKQELEAFVSFQEKSSEQALDDQIKAISTTTNQFEELLDSKIALSNFNNRKTRAATQLFKEVKMAVEKYEAKVSSSQDAYPAKRRKYN